MTNQLPIRFLVSTYQNSRPAWLAHLNLSLAVIKYASTATSIACRTRELKRTTVMPAIAGNLFAAFLNTWLSIIPPAVGRGCKQRIAPRDKPTGAATSPMGSTPSLVST